MSRRRVKPLPVAVRGDGTYSTARRGARVGELAVTFYDETRTGPVEVAGEILVASNLEEDHGEAR